MSQATELLNSMSPAYGTTSESEPHIIIDSNRVVTVPEELKRLAVQYDHRIEKITFDCPRYWDEHDMSRMHVYVNYLRSDGEKGSDLCTNVVVDKDDETMMHFDWEITGHLSAINGNVSFLVCIMKSTPDGEISERHWNSELNIDCYVSEGLEAAANIYAVQPGVIDALLTRMEEVDNKTTDEALVGYVEDFVDNNMNMFQEVVNESFDEYMHTKDGVDSMSDSVKDYLDNGSVVSVRLGSDISGDGVQIVIDRTVDVGSTFVVSNYLQSATGYYTDSAYLSKGQWIDFTNGYLPVNEDKQALSRLIVINAEDIIIDMVEFSEIADTKKYVATEDIIIAISSKRYFSNSSVVYEIREPYNFTMMAEEIVIDPTLTIEGAAADAKAVGNKFNNINDIINENQQYLFNLHNSLTMSLYDNVNEITPSDVMLGTIFSTNSCKIGDSISGLRPYASPGYFMYEGDIQAGDVLEIADNFSIPEGLIPSDNNRKMLIVNNEGIIVDMVDSAYLTIGYAYVVPIDGRVIVSDGYKVESEIPLFLIKHPYDYLDRADETLTKSGKAADAKVVGDKFEELARSSKPYFINMDNIDTTNPAVGEAVIDAFFAGRTLVVTDSTQDPGVDQRGYRFVQWVGLPRNGWNMVELRLNDGSSINLAAATRTGDNPYEEYENN